MEDNQKLGIVFYAYMAAEVILGIAALMLYNRGFLTLRPGVNILLFTLIIQVALHAAVNFYGYTKGIRDIYTNFYTFSIPPIFMILISWFNTF